MNEKLDLYKCNVCGNIIQVIIDGEGELICCGKPMEKLIPNTQENVTMEYHIPVYITDDSGFTSIQIGKELHPMTEEHHIEFIERISADKKCLTLRYLETTQEPRLELQHSIGKEKAIELCNLHGLWEGNNDKQ